MKKKLTALALTFALIFSVGVLPTPSRAAVDLTPDVISALSFGKAVNATYESTLNEKNSTVHLYSFKTTKENAVYSISIKGRVCTVVTDSKSVKADDTLLSVYGTNKDFSDPYQYGSKDKANSKTFYYFDSYSGTENYLKKNKTYYVAVFGNFDNDEFYDSDTVSADYTLTIKKKVIKKKANPAKFIKNKTLKQKTSTYNGKTEKYYEGITFVSDPVTTITSTLKSAPKGGKKKVYISGNYASFDHGVPKGTYKFTVKAKASLYYKASKTKTITIKLK